MPCDSVITVKMSEKVNYEIFQAEAAAKAMGMDVVKRGNSLYITHNGVSMVLRDGTLSAEVQSYNYSDRKKEEEKIQEVRKKLNLGYQQKNVEKDMLRNGFRPLSAPQGPTMKVEWVRI